MLGHPWRWVGKERTGFPKPERFAGAVADCAFLDITMDYKSFTNT